jgi:hypothetical protein
MDMNKQLTNGEQTMKEYKLTIYFHNEPQLVIVANLETLIKYINRVSFMAGITVKIEEN